MKKLLSILLVLVLLLSPVPASLASEEADAAAKESIEEDADETIEEIINETTEEIIEENIDENAEEAMEDSAAKTPGEEPIDEPAVEAPALDGVSGSLDISQVAQDASLVLKGDTTITVDRDQTLRSISGGHSLTLIIQPGRMLTVNNQSGHGIDVSSLTVSGSGALVVTASRNGIYTDGDIDITGITLHVDSVGEGVYSRNRSVTMDCDATLLSTGGSAIYARLGSVILGGNITATTTDNDSPCILSGGTDGTYVSSGYIRFNEGMYTVTARDNAVCCSFGKIDITGYLKAASSEGYGIVSYLADLFGSPAFDTITFNGAQVEARGASRGIYCGGDIVIMDSLITASGSGTAICAHKGFTMGSKLSILTPEGGYIKGDTIVDPNGDAASLVEIGTERISGTASLPAAAVSGMRLSVIFSGTNFEAETAFYQWQRKSGGIWEDIPGQTDSAYTVSSRDMDQEIRVVVSAPDLLGTLVSGTCACTEGIALTEANFPDAVFRQYLKDEWDKNGDSILTDTELNVQNELHLGGTALQSLEGIQLLGTVAYLYAYNTKLTAFDGTGLPYLAVLDLSDCALDSLDVSTCSDLRELLLSGGTGTLSDLDLSGNPELRVLETYDSHITTYLDISTCPHLVDAALHGEVIKYGSGANATTAYHISSRNYLRTDGYGNETVAHFDEAFPDAGFRALLQNDKNLNWDKNNDLSISEAKNVKYLLPEDSEEGIQSLAGIEFFPNLIHLSAFNCRIGELDVSKNKALTYLDLDMNALKSLDVSQNPALTTLFVSNNSLTELDVSQNTALKSLACFGNGIESLDISQSPNLLSAYRGTREEKTDADTGVTYYRYSDGTNVLCVDKDTVMVTGAETGLLGDVDKNGRIEPADAAMVLRDPSSCEVSVGDVSSDNAVNAYDAALILQYSVDKITKFPAENNL